MNMFTKRVDQMIDRLFVTLLVLLVGGLFLVNVWRAVGL